MENINSIYKILKINGHEIKIPEKFESLDLQDRMHLAEFMIEHKGTFTHQSEIVNFIISTDGVLDLPQEPPFTLYEDSVNFNPKVNVEIEGVYYELTEEELKDKTEEYEDLLTDAKSVGGDTTILEEICKSLSSLSGGEYPSVLQWYSCSDCILAALEEIGEVVLNQQYWGRTDCGQALQADRCMQLACYNLARIWVGHE